VTSPQGIRVLSAADYTKPWLISGSGRSGTTALARVCAALGLRLLSTHPVNAAYEPMVRAYASRDLDEIRGIRKEWTAGCVIKMAGLGVTAGNDPAWASALDCNYIFSSRDAVAQTFYDQRQHPEADVGELLRNRTHMEELGVSSAILLSQSTGVIMVSYEKLIQPASNVALVAHLCTLIGGTPDNLALAVQAVEPESPLYENAWRKRP
jgi:hypothetical protein